MIPGYIMKCTMQSLFHFCLHLFSAQVTPVLQSTLIGFGLWTVKQSKTYHQNNCIWIKCPQGLKCFIDRKTSQQNYGAQGNPSTSQDYPIKWCHPCKNEIWGTLLSSCLVFGGGWLGDGGSQPSEYRHVHNASIQRP